MNKKKLFLAILFLCNILNANDCKYYGDKMLYFSKKVEKISKDNPTDYCNLADNLELLVNYAGNVKNVCANGAEIDSSLKIYMNLLTTTSMKCKK